MLLQYTVLGILGSRRAILCSSSCKITWHNVGSITFNWVYSCREHAILAGEKL